MTDKNHPWGWRALSAGLFVMVVGGAVFGVLDAKGLLPSWFFGAQGPVHRTSANDVVGFADGCEPFEVIAQNRWTPVGAAIRAAPKVTSRKVGAVAPNIPILVDGWIHGEIAYPYNSAPFNSDVWFHLADDSGWVSFGGVRAVPTEPDPSLHSPDGGVPAATPDECEGAIRG